MLQVSTVVHHVKNSNEMCGSNCRGVARLTLMVGHTFYNTTYLLLYLMACWFIRAFIYGCFKSAKYE